MINVQLINLASKATEILLQNTTEKIFKKIETAKSDDNKEETIQKLDEIIRELIEERSELDKIIKEYDEILSMQKISKKDINYITKKIIPIFSDLMESDLISNDEDIDKDEVKQVIELLKPVLSIETFTILQLLGFNFKEAIGKPLTKIVNKSIDKEDETKMNYEYNTSVVNREKELFKLLQTEEGREIYERLIQTR